MSHGEFEVQFENGKLLKQVFFSLFQFEMTQNPSTNCIYFSLSFFGCIRFLHFLQQLSPSIIIHPSIHRPAETVWGILSIIVLYLASLQSQKPPEFDPVPQHHRGRKGWLKKDGWMILLSCCWCWLWCWWWCCYLLVVNDDVVTVGTFWLLRLMLMAMMLVLCCWWWWWWWWWWCKMKMFY